MGRRPSCRRPRRRGLRADSRGRGPIAGGTPAPRPHGPIRPREWAHMPRGGAGRPTEPGGQGRSDPHSGRFSRRSEPWRTRDRGRRKRGRPGPPELRWRGPGPRLARSCLRAIPGRPPRACHAAARLFVPGDGRRQDRRPRGSVRWGRPIRGKDFRRIDSALDGRPQHHRAPRRRVRDRAPFRPRRIRVRDPSRRRWTGIARSNGRRSGRRDRGPPGRPPGSGSPDKEH